MDQELRAPHLTLDKGDGETLHRWRVDRRPCSTCLNGHGNFVYAWVDNAKNPKGTEVVLREDGLAWCSRECSGVDDGRQ